MKATRILAIRHGETAWNVDGRLQGHRDIPLGDTGRVLLRPSGTEPLVRVMAEAETQQQADEVCDRLAKVVADELTL